MDENTTPLISLLEELRGATSALTTGGLDAVTPTAGQLWRGRWEGSACLLLLIDVQDSVILAAPVTLNADDADDQSVVAPAELLAVQMAATIWLGLAHEIPMRVLDRPIGSATSPPAEGTRVEQLESLPRGRRVHTPADPRALVRARLLDTVETFAEATWVPSHQGGLPALLEDVDFTALAGVLGSPAAALAVKRGKQPLTAAQAQQLAALVNRDPGDLLAGNPALPDELVAVFDRPQVRGDVVRLAQRRGITELQARRDAAYGVLAMAARQSRGLPPDWGGRTRQYFAAQLEDEG